MTLTGLEPSYENLLIRGLLVAYIVLIFIVAYIMSTSDGYKKPDRTNEMPKGKVSAGRSMNLFGFFQKIIGAPLKEKKEGKEEKKEKEGKEEVREELTVSRIGSSSGKYRTDALSIEREMSALSLTQRGKLWSHRATWYLPTARRSEENRNFDGIQNTKEILLRFNIDPDRGFLSSSDPIQRLPFTTFHIWEDLADDLPKLLGARLGQAREPLRILPVLPTEELVRDADLRRAHLLLCLFAHAYIWGGKDPIPEIPRGIAIPLWEVSEKLGIPPILGHVSIVMYNWRRLDVNAEICMENICTLNNFFDGRDESWFYLITVEIEARGAHAIVPILLAIDAIKKGKHMVSEQCFVENGSLSSQMGEIVIERESSDCSTDDENESDGEIWQNASLRSSRSGSSKYPFGDATMEIDEKDIESAVQIVTYVIEQLTKVSIAIATMKSSIVAMREGCHPFIFFHRVRPFLSGWKHNPTLPDGVIYRGVKNDEPQMFYGGSAAQSSLIPTLDIALGITHESKKSNDFLEAMRDYMCPKHREFLVYLREICEIRQFVLLCSEMKVEYHKDLRKIYDLCVTNLEEFRSAHLNLVAEYIMSQQAKDAAEKGGIQKHAGGKGTGGTDLMGFLKPIRDDCRKSVLEAEQLRRSTSQQADSPQDDSKVYFKDCGDPEDIDLYRGGQTTTSSSLLNITDFRYYGVSVLGKLSDDEIEDIIVYSSNAYYNRIPILTDKEYDRIKTYMAERKQRILSSGGGGIHY